jgi:hypothetical protein
MKKSAKLTPEEKQTGKRKFLIPSEKIQELMQPITEEEFAALVEKAIPPSPRSETEAK